MTNIVTVTVNPVIDIHYFTNEFQTGRDNLVSCRKIFAAGKGMNVSRALQTFAISAEAFLLLGGENASEYLQLAADYNVPISWIPAEGSIRENISINTPDTETRICMKNFMASPALLSKLSALMTQKIMPGTAVVFSGSLPGGITQHDFAAFVLSVREAVPACKIILDCPSLTLDTIAFLSPFLIKPNQKEAAMLLGTQSAAAQPFSSSEGIRQAEQLCARGNCTHTVVSYGASGAAYASASGTSGFLPAPHPEPVCSTVGAGDSMLAGILYGFLQKNISDLKNALSWGIAFGNAACLTKGTCPPAKETILKLMHKL